MGTISPLFLVEEIMTIAEEFGIKHPINKKTGESLVIIKSVGEEFINVARH